MNNTVSKKLTIQPGCITCGACEFIAPEVFEVTDISHIKENVDISKNKSCIQKAIEACPVNVIEYADE
jgi:ferredoxin